MLFFETQLKGAFLIEAEEFVDERGVFARTFCQKEFEAHNLNTRTAQCSISFNKSRGTLRGMHYQIPPYRETKLVRCTMGAIFDVIIDLRPGSPTFAQHFAVILSAQNRKTVYVPEGLAHGFQTLQDKSEVNYQMSEFYSPAHARGVRWDDPVFGIQWPESPRIILERDQNYPDFDPSQLHR